MPDTPCLSCFVSNAPDFVTRVFVSRFGGVQSTHKHVHSILTRHSSSSCWESWGMPRFIFWMLLLWNKEGQFYTLGPQRSLAHHSSVQFDSSVTLSKCSTSGERRLFEALVKLCVCNKYELWTRNFRSLLQVKTWGCCWHPSDTPDMNRAMLWNEIVASYSKANLLCSYILIIADVKDGLEIVHIPELKRSTASVGDQKVSRSESWHNVCFKMISDRE